MDDLAKIAEALGDPLRVQILDLLASGRLTPCCSPANPESPAAVCACDLAPELGGLGPSKLAYHLARLRAAGLVQEQRRGKWVYYSINRETLAGLCRELLGRWARAAAACASGACAAPTREQPPGRPARASGRQATASGRRPAKPTATAQRGAKRPAASRRATS